MVVSGCFEVKIVQADSKIPFPEHSKDGKTYVEAEPDAEYFISISKLQKTETDISVAIAVDGTPTSSWHFNKRYIDSGTKYNGILSATNGVANFTALRFVKPRISAQCDARQANLLMGKVEVTVSQLTYTGRILDNNSRNIASNFTEATVDLNSGAASKKKNLRSGMGTATVASSSLSKHESVVGARLDTITLNYCSALGLMEVGVLKKPGHWEYHRMKHPAGPGDNANAVKGAVDMSTADSDDE